MLNLKLKYKEGHFLSLKEQNLLRESKNSLRGFFQKDFLKSFHSSVFTWWSLQIWGIIVEEEYVGLFKDNSCHWQLVFCNRSWWCVKKESSSHTTESTLVLKLRWQWVLISAGVRQHWYVLALQPWVYCSLLVGMELFRSLLMSWLGSGDLSYFVKTNLSCNHCHEFTVKMKKLISL